MTRPRPNKRSVESSKSAEGDQPTLVDRWVLRLKNHRWFAGVLFVGMCVVAVATFVEQVRPFVREGIALVRGALGLERSSTPAVIPRRPDISLERELQDVREVWFAMHSGSVKLAEGDFFRTPRAIRLLLMSPDAVVLPELHKINVPGGRTVAQTQEDIRTMTGLAASKGACVRWFDGPIQNTTIIADPRDDGAWARVELLIPFTAPADRPSILIAKRDDSDRYNILVDAYEKLWDQAMQRGDEEHCR